MFFDSGVHVASIGFEVPPHEAEIAVHDSGAWVNVADDALAAGNSAGEAMSDGVSGFVFGDGGVGDTNEFVRFSGGESAISEASPWSRVYGRAVIGVDHMAGRAATGAEVAGVIICAEKIEGGIEQPGFLKSDEDGVGSVCGAESAIAEPRSGPTGFFEAFGDAGVGNKASPAFEDAKDVSGLGDFKARKRIEVRENSFSGGFFRRGSGDSLEALWCPVHAVAFTVHGPFFRDGAVVVEGSAPEHATVSHHAFFDFESFGAMATGGAAADVGNAKVSGIDEANELGVFMIENGVGADGVCGGTEDVGKAGMNMGFEFGDSVRVSAVAIDASEFNGITQMGVVGVGVAADAAGAFGERLLVGLA